MNIGIIGYGSMGKMLLEKFAVSEWISSDELLVYNRHPEKLADVAHIFNIAPSSAELAAASDIIFVCVRPTDMRDVLESIRDSVRQDALVVSLNGSIPFVLLEKLIPTKLAKVIPSVTAEIDRSQTLVCYNSKVSESDKAELEKLLRGIGSVTELPENELGMGSELVSCMPGFIASIFDCVTAAAQKHTSIPKEQIVSMVLNTLSATSELMLSEDMSFSDVVTRVATKGGITEEGTKVIYDGFPDICDELFEKTLDKRRTVAEKAKEAFKEEQ